MITTLTMDMKHAYYVNIYQSVRHTAWSEAEVRERCQDSGYRGHTNGQCHITFRQVCPNVGRGSSRRCTYQDHTNGPTSGLS